ncbi:MAG TPA: SdpI family protein [Pirellulaceae bacterium]|jgi:immunity protein, SdpI family|nr:SdpI family protein [Pirellulaceae bacterium]
MTRLYIYLTVGLVALALAASLILYPRLPAVIPTHWNIEGKIDGYGSKTWATFLMPAIMAGMLLLFWALPWLSPKHFEVDSFRATYWFIALVVTGMMGFVHALTLWAALEAGNRQVQVDITRLLLAGLLVMFVLIGNVMGKVRRNFYVGIRTPWTLASERVWNDTHRLAARMFVVAGALGLLAIVLPLPLPAVVIVVIGLIMVAAVWPIVYSLLLYKRLERRGEV